MTTWLIPRTQLTPGQLRIVELPMTQHRLISGLPGSGKTQVLVHRAAYLRERYNILDNRFKIFILTNVLREYIGSGLTMLNLPDRSACTFDSWCVEFYQRHISRRLPWDNAGRIFDFTGVKREILRLLRSHKELRTAFDFVLVDEGQDLVPESFAILQNLSSHITVFADQLQQIYEGGANERSILEALGQSPGTALLLGAYRKSPDVARLASYFISDAWKQNEYLMQCRNQSFERESPLFFVAPSYEEELDRLAQVIRQREMMNQRVGIIVAKNNLLDSLAKGLEERNIMVEKAVSQSAKKRGEARQRPYRFDSLAPKIASYHSAKGLTFDCVLLPRLTEDSFHRFDGLARQRLLFVGIARAMQWVYLSTVAGKEMKEICLFEKAATNKHLVIQRGSADSPRRRARGPTVALDEYSVF